MHDNDSGCIATLGPEGTFSELAAIRYAGTIAPRPEISLLPTIKKVFQMAQQNCGTGIVPIENMSEGYVQATLDLLLRTPLKIVRELVVPVRFSFISHAASLDAVSRVYAQFVAQGQCQNFLEGMSHAQTITTASNTEALPLIVPQSPEAGAIIPAHCLRAGHGYPLVVQDVADYANNETRFVVLGSEDAPHIEGGSYRTSIALVNVPERPGILNTILSVLAARKLNLTSIMSRPTKERLGSYLFHMDIEGHQRDPAIKDAFQKIRDYCDIIVFGSYTRMEQ